MYHRLKSRCVTTRNAAARLRLECRCLAGLRDRACPGGYPSSRGWDNYRGFPAETRRGLETKRQENCLTLRAPTLLQTPPPQLDWDVFAWPRCRSAPCPAPAVLAVGPPRLPPRARSGGREPQHQQQVVVLSLTPLPLISLQHRVSTSA